jgi:peptidyl-prolyl cis-trans isomerase D
MFLSVLANNQLSEQRYVELVRQDIERTMLTGAVAGGATAPSSLVEPLYRRQNEKRVAATVLVANASMTGIPDPSDAELQAFYDKHQADFQAPEYRGFTVLELKPDDIAPGIEVPEENLHKEYDARQAEFETPEKRQLEQILVSDEAKAKEAEAQLAAGKSFAEVAKTVAGQDEKAIEFGWIVRKDMPQQLGDAVFALAKGGVSKPIHDALGWHILRVSDIQPAATKPFAAVRDQLRTEVARDMAADQLFKERNDIEDALAGGATLDEVAAKFKMKKTAVPSVDLDGKDPKGARAAVTDPDILHTAFNTDKGEVSRLIDTKDNGYYILRVDNVTPTAERPLAEVKDKVKGMVLADKRKAAAEAEAKAISDAIGKGKSLADIAGEKHLEVSTSPPLLRTSGSDSGLPPAVVARVFTLKPKATGVAEGPEGWYAVQLESIEEPDPKADKAAVEALAADVTKGMQSDILAEFDKALRARYPVEIKRKEIDRLL